VLEKAADHLIAVIETLKAEAVGHSFDFVQQFHCEAADICLFLKYEISPQIVLFDISI